MDFISVIGYIAAILTTVSFLPQAIKTIKDKTTDGISLGMYSMFTSGVLLWLVYGFFVKDIPIIIANSITFILAVTILALTIKYSTKVNQK
ncbi:SemiSWEET transporter [Neobacillus drentensis]|uniref:SemiSWEET transporter n=1 Tax=Neobacillus drentensis TaxID=220684 RepID=UPI003001B72A